MKFCGRKHLRTCLSMLLIVTCLLTSFLFENIQADATEQVVDSFYILDEDGNPVTIEITQEQIMSQFEDYGISLLAEDELDENSETNVIGVVRFKSSNYGVVNYTEVDTGRAGYFNCYSAGDAAYIRTESDGSVICKLSGVVMRVPSGNVKEIVSYEDCAEGQISYYYVSDTGYLMHCYTYYIGSSLYLASTRIGYKPSYLTTGVKYYSYDGHYFYADFTTMISDYQNSTYSNAVNTSTPYYNYYQYLSFHTVAPFTAEEYDSYVKANKTDSVMTTTGNAFVSAQKTYTINALMMFGVAINESGWGTSTYAKTKNNLFGLNAVDSNPDDAKKFESLEACINEFAYEWMHKDYLNGGDSRYRGPHLGDKHSGINVKYASDPYWGEKAAARGYYLDTNKVDYGRYTIGIASSGKISAYKEANTGSQVIYTTDASNGSNIYDYPVVILEEVTGNGGELFYKVISDMSLKDDRSARNVEAHYNSSRDYVYVKASEIQVVFVGSGSDITIPDVPTPDESVPDVSIPSKTHEEVLSSLGVVNTNNYLTGFSVGSDVSTLISKVSALDSTVQIVAKNASGAQITSGTVATGMTLTITTNGSTITYTIVIRGDVSGDGKLSAVDYVKLRNYLDRASTLSDAYLKSADASGDGNVSALDYVKLRNHLDNKSAIVQ